MICVDGRGKAILDQFEEEPNSPQKYSEAHMTTFKHCVQKIDEIEE